MKYLGLLLTTVLLVPSYVSAAPDVKISIEAEKVVLVEEAGKKVEKRMPAEEALPGDVLVYMLMYKNQGDEAAKDIRLDDPIPVGTVYVVDSAFGPGSEISFSIDDAKTFKKPSLLSYEVKLGGETIKRKASPDQYTHIRWTIKEIGAGKSGMAGFRVRVK